MMKEYIKKSKLIKTIKKQIFIYCLVRCIFIMLIVLLFYFTERRTLEQWYHGPVLAGNQSFAELENQYVEIEVIGLYGPYNIMTHETNGKEFIDKEYYVARECNNGELIALLNSPGLTKEHIFYSDTNKNIERMDKLLEEKEKIRCDGYLTKMSSDDLEIFNEELVSHGEKKVTEAYNLSIGYFEETSISTVITMLYGAGILVVLSLLSWLPVVTKKYNRKINKFLKKNPDVTIEDMIHEFDIAQPLEAKFWISEKFIYMNFEKGGAFMKTDECVWAFEKTIKINIVKKHRVLKVCDLNGNVIRRNILKGEIEKFYAVFRAKAPHVILGYYDKDMELYRKDMDAFLEQKYNIVMNKRREKEMQEEVAANSFEGMWKQYKGEQDA